MKLDLPESKNISLYWDKYSSWEFREALSEGKTEAIVPRLFSKLVRISSGNWAVILDHLNKQRDSLVQRLNRENQLIDFQLKINGKLLIGSGSPSIIDVGMTFSRNYGVPIIPSSGIKGTFSHYCKDTNLFCEDEFKLVFGEDLSFENDNIRGNVIFLDAFPVSGIRFGLDLVNNHFQRYYMNGEIPNDWYNPVPVTYVVLTEGQFRFTVLVTKKIPNLAKKIEDGLKNMLTTYGIGSKTNYGYGRFSVKQ